MEIGLIAIAYTAWAIYSGWKFMCGRIEYLEQPGILNVILKVVCSIFVGYVIGAFQLIVLILKGLAFFWKGMS